MAVDGGVLYVTTELNDEELKKGIKDAQRELIRFQRDAERLTEQKVKIEAEIDLKQFEFERKLQEIREKAETQKIGVKSDAKIRKIDEGAQARINSLTAQYEDYVTRADDKVQKINQSLQSNIKNQDALTNSIAKGNEELDERLSGTAFNDRLNQNITNIQGKIGNIGSKMEGIIRKVGRWAIALFGIRSMYSLITSSMSTISGYNEQLGVDIAYIKFALASTLQPVVEWLVKQAYQLLSVIGSIIKLITGYDIFQYATMSNFKKSQGYLKGANKQAKELKKTLAGFDEMNILGDNTKADSDTAGKITTPSMKIDTKLNDVDIKDWFKNLAKGINDFFKTTDWKKVAEDISDFIIAVFTGFGDFVEAVDIEALTDAIITFFSSVKWGEIADAIITALGKAIGKAVVGNILLGEGIEKKMFGDDENKIRSWLLNSDIGTIIYSVFESITSMFPFLPIIKHILEHILGNLLVGLGQYIQEHGEKDLEVIGEFILNTISKPFGGKAFEEAVKLLLKAINKIFFGTETPSTTGKNNPTSKIGAGIVGSMSEGVKQKITSFLLPFTTIISTIKEKFKGLPTWIKETLMPSLKSAFGKISSTMADVIGNKLKSVINGVVDGVQTMINGAIDNINKLIKGINAVGSLLHLGNIKELSKPKLPKLAMGGIVNMPSRGVPVGGAIAGERGPEGVIPLTDSQQMALLGEAIGKYISLNATIPVYVGNRQIARELKKINAENDFAYNR